MPTLSFALQTQLELFLEQLQSLIDESLIFILEQHSQNFIYEYSCSQKFTIMIFKVVNMLKFKLFNIFHVKGVK